MIGRSALVILIVSAFLFVWGCGWKTSCYPGLIAEWELHRLDAPPYHGKEVDYICYHLTIEEQSEDGLFYGKMCETGVVYDDGTEHWAIFPQAKDIENAGFDANLREVMFEWTDLLFEGEVNHHTPPDHMSGFWTVGWLVGEWQAWKQ